MAEIHTEEERLQALEILRNSYKMYERSKAETIKVRKEKKDKDGNRIYTDKSLEETLELMNTMQKDVKDKYLALGGKEEDLAVKVGTKKISDKKALLEKLKAADERDAMRAYIEKMNGISNQVEDKDIPEIVSVPAEEETPDYAKPIESYIDSAMSLSESASPEPATTTTETVESREYNFVGNKAAYDVVKLPSGGECYKNRMKEVMVSYLTAYDENLILSPNLYTNGTFFDHILKNKILGDVNPDDLISGDRDAIVIWLRASGYGNEYPIRVEDRESGEEFETVADLSELKYKEFKLKGDSNGYFDFQLPKSGDIIKFRFLTVRDGKKLEEMRKDESKTAKIAAFKRSIREMRSSIEDNDLIEGSKYNLIENAINTLENEILEKFDKLPDNEFTHELTDRLILSTVSINGITDRKFIVDYLLRMNVTDAKAYRNYMIENEPGIDYNIKVKRPDSLGGGYIETFLRLDQFIFVNGI